MGRISRCGSGCKSLLQLGRVLWCALQMLCSQSCAVGAEPPYQCSPGCCFLLQLFLAWQGCAAQGLNGLSGDKAFRRRQGGIPGCRGDGAREGRMVATKWLLLSNWTIGLCLALLPWTHSLKKKELKSSNRYALSEIGVSCVFVLLKVESCLYLIL